MKPELRTPLIFLSLIFLLAGCGDFLDLNKARTEVRFSAERDLIDNYPFRLSFADGNSRRSYRNQDFIPRGASVLGVGTDWAEISTSGELVVTFSLHVVNTGVIISEGEFRIALSKKRSYVAHFLSDSLQANPLQKCVDCAGYFSFGVDTTVLTQDSPLRDDSLYVLWSTTPNN